LPSISDRGGNHPLRQRRHRRYRNRHAMAPAHISTAPVGICPATSAHAISIPQLNAAPRTAWG
jgi:hypothetical protein